MSSFNVISSSNDIYQKNRLTPCKQTAYYTAMRLLLCVLLGGSWLVACTSHDITGQVSATLSTVSADSRLNVFITSFSTAGDFTNGFSDVSGTDCSNAGDAIDKVNCACAAEAGSYNLTGNYFAWLSTLTVYARCNIQGTQSSSCTDSSSSLPYYTFGKNASEAAKLFSNNYTSLVSGNLSNPPSSTSTTRVWTGSDTSGVNDFNVCNNWGSNSSATSGMTGSANSSTGNWARDTTEPCSNPLPFYCFQKAD